MYLLKMFEIHFRGYERSVDAGRLIDMFFDAFRAIYLIPLSKCYASIEFPMRVSVHCIQYTPKYWAYEYKYRVFFIKL